jgi:hypothetical protein
VIAEERTVSAWFTYRDAAKAVNAFGLIIGQLLFHFLRFRITAPLAK